MEGLAPVKWRPINTIEDAVSFLAKRLELEATGTIFGWHIVDNEDFEMFFDDNEGLIEHARCERDVLIGIQGERR
ncbi:MAG: hypothetical protein AAB733_03200 [Patescibacteria group bacterium]